MKPEEEVELLRSRLKDHRSLLEISYFIIKGLPLPKGSREDYDQKMKLRYRFMGKAEELGIGDPIQRPILEGVPDL